MDKDQLSWDWIKRHMPRVTAMVARERELGRGALLGECWRRGVLGNEPGWFYARENGVAIGVPSVEFLRDPTMGALLEQFPRAAMLLLQGQMVGQAEEAPAVPELDRLNLRQQQARAIVDLDERQRRYEESLKHGA
jgi:hypothetical protein